MGKEHKEKQISTSEAIKETPIDKDRKPRDSQRQQSSRDRDIRESSGYRNRRDNKMLKEHTDDRRSRSRVRSRTRSRDDRAEEKQDRSYYGRNKRGETSTYQSRYQQIRDRHHEDKWRHRDNFTKLQERNLNPSKHHDTFEEEQCRLIKTTPIMSKEVISVETLKLFYPAPVITLQEGANIRDILSRIKNQTSTPKELYWKIKGGYYEKNEIQLGCKERDLFEAWHNLMSLSNPCEVPQPSDYFVDTQVQVNGVPFKTLKIGGLHGKNLRAKEEREWIKPEILSSFVSKRGWTTAVGLPGLNVLTNELWAKTVEEIHTHAIGNLGNLVSCWNEEHWTQQHENLNQKTLTQERQKIQEIRLEILGWNTNEVIKSFPMTVQANYILIRQDLLQIYVNKTEVKKEFQQDGIYFGGKKGEKHRRSCHFSTENRAHIKAEYSRQVVLNTVPEDASNAYPFGAGRISKTGNLEKFEISRPVTQTGNIIRPDKMVIRRSAFQHTSKTRSVWMQEVPRGTAEVADLYIDEIPVRDTPLGTDKCNCTPYLTGNIILLSQQLCLTNDELGLISRNSGESLLHIRDPSVVVNIEKVHRNGINSGICSLYEVGSERRLSSPNEPASYMNCSPMELKPLFHDVRDKFGNPIVMDDGFKQFCLIFYCDPITIRMIEKQRNLETDRPSERLQVGERMSGLLRAAAGGEIRYAAGNAMIPANFQGWIYKYHIPQDKNNSDLPRYTFTGLGDLPEQIRDEVSSMTNITCGTCGENMTLESFTAHYDNEHKHEVILINIGDQLGTNTRVYSNLLHYATIKLIALLKESPPTGLNSVMDARSTIALNSKSAITTVPDPALQGQLATQLKYIHELEHQLNNPDISRMKELIGEQQLTIDSQRTEIMTLTESSIKIKLDYALSEKQNAVLFMETEALTKNSKLLKQELRKMELKMRDMVTTHETEAKSMDTKKEERITALHETITVLKLENAQMEDELGDKLRKCKDKIRKFKSHLTKYIKQKHIINALRADIHGKQEELQRLRAGPINTPPGLNNYDPSLLHATSPAYIERDRSPNYLDHRDGDDYYLGDSNSDESKEVNKSTYNLPDTVLEVNTI